MSQSIVFTGGGTGGHVFPGLAVLEELRRSFAGEVHWIGSGNGMERKIVEEWGIPFHGIPSGKLRREFSFRNFTDLFRVIGGIFASYSVLRKLRPLALFSKGGYVSVPPVIAARLRGIPVVTHESDSDPGLATRINSRFADRICVPYPETAEHFPPPIRERVLVTGNPVRADVFRGRADAGHRIVDAPTGRPILLVLGGSQGARRVNRMVEEVLSQLCRDFYVVHQTGAGNSLNLQGPVAGYHPLPFIGKEYGHILAAADLIVSRAGAGTLWEIAVAAKPSILLPLSGSGTRGDQVRNAELFRARGAAVVLGEKASAADLAKAAAELAADPERRQRMGEAAAGIGNRDAAVRIARLIAQVAGLADRPSVQGELPA
ncbi:undecaprenyldiphospho-muramoylpentapeptide beta-N-acetylglucosaminyltransferase [Salinispira pacifica]